MASSSSSKHCRKHVGSKSMETDEIIKYMSSLPSYLERGKPIQDRALNFGVLDWGQLEQWQYHHHHHHHHHRRHHHHHKEGVIRTKKYSPSGNISSNNSSLQSHLNMSLLSHLNMSQEDISTKDTLVNHSSKTTSQSRTKPKSSSSSSSSSSSKGKMKMQEEMVNESGNFQDSCYGHKTIVFNGKKSEESHLEPIENETVNKKNSQKESSSKRNPRRHHFGFSMNCKSEAFTSATKLESPPVSQNPPEDSKIKEKVKMNMGICKEVRTSSRKQALFQMKVKNGRPLFTFAVDENKDIVAATVRSLTGKDETNSWIYTFFMVHEVKKKKSGWLSHGIKDKDNSYPCLPNIMAQMKVSNPEITDCTTREFVLSSVDPGQPTHQILDVQLENELAAIVVRFPRIMDEEENQDCFCMTVILPGGHHSVPRKGEPSPLIKRWRSGGRCDCDGWDVGCRLRTLANNRPSEKRSNPSESFDLFLQGDVINERPFFSLSMIKEGTFSVDYNSSLTLLHAFSICISVIECRKSSRHTELRTYVAKLVDDDVAPVTYASLPPVSPAGRV